MEISIWLKGLKKLFLWSDCKNIQKNATYADVNISLLFLCDYNRLIEWQLYNQIWILQAIQRNKGDTVTYILYI